jgi:hypothetical protein
MGKILVVLGIAFIVVGILWTYRISIPYLGKLPGDIYVKGEHYSFYFPIVTCLIVSLVLSLLFYLFSSK